MTKGPTESQWRLEIEKALGRSSDDGMTAKEIAAQLKLSLKTTMWRLHDLQAAGKLQIGWRQITNMAGISGRTPVYWIRKEKKK